LHDIGGAVNKGFYADSSTFTLYNFLFYVSSPVILVPQFYHVWKFSSFIIILTSKY